MSLVPDEALLVSPEEVLEGPRASLITGMAIARAWRNPGYRDRLVTAPREVLAQDGLIIPESMTIRVFEDTPSVKHVSITRWTSEPEELAALFRGLVPLPAGTEVRVVQNTEDAVCLVVPVAAPEPELVTDVERLRRLAPRASIFASAESVVSVAEVAAGEVESVAASVATELGSSASASASATAHAATETETATATATASGIVSGTISGGGNGSVYGSGSAQVLASGSAAQVASASGSVQSSGAVLVLSSGSVSSSASSDTAVSTQTNEVTNASTFAEVDISVVSEGASATLAVEAEAVATTSTGLAEAEAVAVVVIVVS